MAKKQSFGDKTAKGQAGKDWKYVKYVESVLSEKTGRYRFNERMIRLDGGENLDSALKRMNEFEHAQDIEMPTFEEPVIEEVAEKAPEEAEDDNNSEEVQEDSSSEE